MPHLTGERIRLREYRQEDLGAMRAWVNDEQTVGSLSTLYWAPQSSSNTADALDRAMHSLGNAAYFVIADRVDDHYLGQIDLYAIDWKLRCGTLGMVIGHENQRGKGYGAEALALLLRYSFLTLGLERVELEVNQENQRAVRCYQKAGFVLEGVKRHAFYHNGAFCDVAVMSVLAGEWREREALHTGT